MQKKCPFCHLPAERILKTTAHSLIIRDGYPISKGHSLIIPKRHIASLFDASIEEQHDLLQTLTWAKTQLDQQLKADGYNIGINDGETAGQTVMHLHIHLIPRYQDDSEDPRGGVRWIFPDKADYWTKN
ncbi:MAG: HIT domain-containing protein [Methylococcaceae bacterium]|nr:HIT domain-containing protein [Methylococcaceae bacterium]